MKLNVSSDERIPRIALAITAGIGAVFATTWLKTGLFGIAAGLLASVATGYCPINAALEHDEPEPTWRTLKTYRVEG